MRAVRERGDTEGWKDTARGPEVAMQPVWATLHRPLRERLLASFFPR